MRGNYDRVRVSGTISTDILECRARVLAIQAFGRPRDPLLPGSRPQTHGPAGSGGRLSVIRRPRRLMGTSRRPVVVMGMIIRRSFTPLNPRGMAGRPPT